MTQLCSGCYLCFWPRELAKKGGPPLFPLENIVDQLYIGSDSTHPLTRLSIGASSNKPETRDNVVVCIAPRCPHFADFRPVLCTGVRNYYSSSPPVREEERRRSLAYRAALLEWIEGTVGVGVKKNKKDFLTPQMFMSGWIFARLCR